MPLILQVITTSTRPGRIGPLIAEWMSAVATEDERFAVESVDLADMGLPLYDEAEHPVSRRYAHEHTRRWAATVDRADAYIFVLPEYNCGPPASLINALTYVYLEWNYKAAGFVSYGGVSGGIRAVQETKLHMTTMKVMPVLEAVTIPMFPDFLSDGAFKPAPIHEQSASAMLDELYKWGAALRSVRMAGAEVKPA